MGNVMRYGYPVDVRKETLARINDIRAQLGPTTQTYPGADGVTDQDIGGVFGNAPKTRSITPAGAETVLSVEDVPESVMAGEAQSLADLKKAAKAAGFPPALYNDPAFLRDESRLGLMASQQTDVGPTDMAKLHSRSYGEGYTTPEEKRRGAVISGIERIVNRTVPGQLAVKGFKEYADIESPKEFLSRPAYEQSYLRDLAQQENVRYGRDQVGAGSRQGLGGGIADIIRSTSASTTSPRPTESTTGTTPNSATSNPYYWDLGLNIPSPTDKNYTEYQNYLRERAAAQAAMFG
jgi:hypothetical protein